MECHTGDKYSKSTVRFEVSNKAAHGLSINQIASLDIPKRENELLL